MNDVNILVGLSGVGKSTVLEEARNLSDKEYQVINYGDRMIEIAKERGLVEHRDEMKDLDVETYKDIQKKAAESIVEDAEEGEVIVDTHAAIKSPYGYIPGLPKWTIENLQPDKIVMLTAPSEDIYRRSKGDEERDREHDSAEAVEEYQEVAREMAATGSVLTGAYLQVIENEEGKAQEAAEELVETLQA
ncbi:MAG: adenylate kinase [Candidatus Nanohalobium sp.]